MITRMKYLVIEIFTCNWVYIKNGKGKYMKFIITKRKQMATREKANKGKVLKYIQEQFENAKEMKLFQMLRKEVEIGKNGTQRYVIKKGPNKGKIVG
jgi:hypothetical protein